nr:hypothetical protein CFP56_13923 [Quercus suber]
MMAANVTFPKIQLWVQVWGLPFDLMNEEVGLEIDRSLGEVMNVDAKAIALEHAWFLQGDPMINPEGDKAWVALKYEAIVGLCYLCGRLGHEARDHKHSGNGTLGGTHPNLGNPSGLTRTAATREETLPDIRDDIGKTNAILRKVEQIDLEARSEEGELMQCNIPDIEGKVAGAINMVPSLTSAHIYGKIGHMYETFMGLVGMVETTIQVA